MFLKKLSFRLKCVVSPAVEKSSSHGADDPLEESECQEKVVIITALLQVSSFIIRCCCRSSSLLENFQKQTMMDEMVEVVAEPW